MAIDLANKKYSPGQIAISVWDEAENRIRVDAEVTAVIGELQVDLDAADDSVAIGDGTNLLDVNSDGSINVTSTEATDISYAEVNGIASNVLTTIISEVLLTSKKLNKVIFSGSNLAEYTLLINSNANAKYRTSVTDLNGQIILENLQLNIGDVVEIQAITPKNGGTDINASLIYSI